MEPNCTYLLKVQRLRTDQNRAGIVFFVGDFEVIETTSYKHRPGDVVNFFTSKDKDGFLGNCKALFTAVVGSQLGEAVRPEDITDDIAGALVGPPEDNPKGLPGTCAAGVKLRCSTRGKKTLKGNDFTVHTWAPVFE
jgi:hypothetical protein